MQQQKYKLIKLLVEENYFSFGDFTLKNGRISPYIARFSTKQGISDKAYSLLSKSSLHLFDNIEQAHVIGLANSGRRLAESIYEEIFAFNPLVTLEIINPKCEVLSMNAKNAYSKSIIVVDNAVTTGKTLIDFKQKLWNSEGAKITSVVKIFDRLEIDNQYGTVDDYLKHEYGILVSSIIHVYDLIDYLNIKKDRINLSRTRDYVTKYCKKQNEIGIM